MLPWTGTHTRWREGGQAGVDVHGCWWWHYCYHFPMLLPDTRDWWRQNISGCLGWEKQPFYLYIPKYCEPFHDKQNIQKNTLHFLPLLVFQVTISGLKYSGVSFHEDPCNRKYGNKAAATAIILHTTAEQCHHWTASGPTFTALQFYHMIILDYKYHPLRNHTLVAWHTEDFYHINYNITRLLAE